MLCKCRGLVSGPGTDLQWPVLLADADANPGEEEEQRQPHDAAHQRPPAAQDPDLRVGIQYTRAGNKGPHKEKAPAGAFSLLQAATIAFTFKTLLIHYAKRTLTPH